MAAPLSDSMRRRLEKEQEAYDGAVGGADETDGAYPALPSDLLEDEAMKQKVGYLQSHNKTYSSLQNPTSEL